MPANREPQSSGEDTSDSTMPVFIRPLVIREFEPDYDPTKTDYVGFDDLFENVKSGSKIMAPFLLKVFKGKAPISIMRKRYRVISNEDYEPIIIPDHPKLKEHIIPPLWEAKLCYVMNMPIACIAQSGLVGEMVALWRFQMILMSGEQPLTEERQKLLFGRRFEELSQHRRIEVLKAYGDLNDNLSKHFDELRKIRNRYLHSMKSVSEADKDAQKAYKHACILVKRTLNITFKDRKMVLPGSVLRFIEAIVDPGH